MKLLCVIDHLYAGGAQRQLVQLAIGMKARGHHVELFTYYPFSHYNSELAAAGIRVHLHAKKSRFDLRPAFGLRKFIKHGHYDAVLSFLETPTFYAELASATRRSWKLVVSERCADPNMLSGLRRLIRWSHRFADSIVTNSHTNRRMLEEHWPKLRPKLSTIYNGVNLDRFHPVSYAHDASNPLRMVVVASYLPRKNMLRVAEALRLYMAKAGPELVIDWYGASPRYPAAFKEAQAYVQQHGLQDRIRFHKPVKDIEQEYNSCDVVGLFSTYEGVPNVICEAMACGKPIILSDVCDARYLIEDGVTGLLCDPLSADSIASALHRFARLDPAARSAMGRAARTHAETIFAPDHMINSYEQVLAVAGNGAGR